MNKSSARRAFSAVGGPLAVLSLMMSGCANQPAPVAGPAPERLVLLAQPPDLVIRTEAQLRDAVQVAARLDRTEGRPLDVTLLPLLYASPAGRAFISMPEPRSLVSGSPENQCPALIASAGQTLADAVSGGVAACREALRAAGAAETCGCQILVAGHVALAPRSRFAYAPGIPARLLRAGALDPLPLVAEESDGDTVLYAGSRPVWKLTGKSGAGATLTPLNLDGSPAAPGLAAKRMPKGLERGRITERVTATDGDGTPLVFLIGG